MTKRMKNIDALFNPRSIAFVGATNTIGKWGFIIFNNLLGGGYEGKLFPVNPGKDKVFQIQAYPSVRDIPEPVDLAVFTIPARGLPAAIDDCAAKKVKACLVISAGFKELGAEGAELEKAMTDKARAAGMVLAGPNGQGVCCPEHNLFPWMPNYFPPDGSVGVISQSGNIQGMIIGGVARSGFGVSKGVSSGNEADLATIDYIEYLVEDPKTEVILSYMEGVNDGRSFMERAKKAASRKPIVVLKGGRTESGVAAANSHTGAMAVSDNLFDAMCRQSGLVRVDTIEEAGIIASSFINRPLPKGRRVGILTGGGGLGVIAADACTRIGLEVPKLSRETLTKIGKLMPDWWVPGNPVDLVAGLNFQSVQPTMEIMMKSGEIDALMLLFVGPPRQKTELKNKKAIDFSKVWKTMSKHYQKFAENIFKLMQELSVPIYVVSNFNIEEDPEVKELFGRYMMSGYPTIENAATAIRAMADYSLFKSR